LRAGVGAVVVDSGINGAYVVLDSRMPSAWMTGRI
jgi:hypothetical protein